MALFDDQTVNDFRRAIRLVEASLEALGVESTGARLPEEAGIARFSFERGSATVLVAVHPPEGATEGTLRVVAPVVRLPNESAQPAFFEHLLSVNARELVGAAFGLLGGDVVLVAERTVRDLDASEVDAMIRTVGREADRFDDLLAEQFGTTRCSDPHPS